MEPIYHNAVFLIVALVVVASLADLIEPRWKIRRRQPRPIKDALREARKHGTEAPEWFSEHEIREVRRRGAVGLAVGLPLLVGLQPSVGWVGGQS